MLSPRILCIVNMVKKTSVAYDIGTDHAFVPLYLCKNNIVDRAFACDINENPLKTAKANIKGYEDRISLLVSDGIESVDILGGALIIAGMGGELIASILSNEKAKKAEQIILQPMTNVALVRRFLYENGFKVENEELVLEKDKIYTVISCLPGKERELSEREFYVSRFIMESEHINKFLKIKINIHKEIVRKTKGKYPQIAKENEKICRFYEECLK